MAHARWFRFDYWRMPDAVGFAAHWTWIWCVFWSSMFYEAMPAGSLPLSNTVPLLEPLWVISLAANVATIGALHLVSRFRNPLFDIKGLLWLAVVLTTVGTVLLARPTLALLGPISSQVYFAGSVLTGVGSAMVVVLWGELFTSIGSKETIAFSVAALLMAAVAYLVISLLPLDVAQLLVACLPLGSVLFLVHFRRGLPHLPRSSRNVLVKERAPRRMIVIALFFGVSFGAMKGLIAPTSADLLGLRDALNIVAIVVGAVAVYVTASICKMDFNHLTYQVALPLMAAGFLFLPLHGVMSVLGTAVHQCGYQYFYIVLWAMWPILATQGRSPAGWMATWGLFAIQLGQLVGSVGAGFVANLLTTDLERAMLSAIIVFAILLVALFVFGTKTVESGWGFLKPVEVQGANTDFDDAATRLARRFKLSPREVEVFFLLAKGRNRAYVAHELAIGDETVKSHVKSLYRKMDLHSQQELIDLVESERR